MTESRTKKLITSLKRIFFYFSMIGFIWLAFTVIRFIVAVSTGMDDEVSFHAQNAATWTVISLFWFALFLVMKAVETFVNKTPKKGAAAYPAPATLKLKNSEAANLTPSDSGTGHREPTKKQFRDLSKTLIGVIVILGCIVLALSTLYLKERQRDETEMDDTAESSLQTFDYEKTRRQAEQGDAVQQVLLGNKYFADYFQYRDLLGTVQNDPADRDLAEAIMWFRKAAEQGEATGEYMLGYVYQEGYGVPRDHTEAAKWFRKAADQGLPDAQYQLGEMYACCGREGELPMDEAEAIEWFRKAAEQAYPPAQVALGNLYAWGGEGVPKNNGEAIRWYRKAAEQEYWEAYYSLGEFYYGKKNMTEAVRSYRKAAELGDASSMEKLGNMYKNGDGVPQNEAETEKWFRMRAELGNQYYSLELGDMYKNGDGVEKDYGEAYVWYSLAVADGYFLWKDKAIEERDKVAEELSPESLARVQQRATQLYEEIYSK